MPCNNHTSSQVVAWEYRKARPDKKGTLNKDKSKSSISHITKYSRLLAINNTAFRIVSRAEGSAGNRILYRMR